MNFWLAALFSTVSVLGYSLISIYIGKVTQKHGAFWTGFWIQIFGLPLTLLFLPIFGLNLAFNIYLIPIAIFGIVMTAVFIMYCKNLSVGPPSVVQSVLRIGTLITFVLAIFFLGEKVTLFKIIGSLMIIFGSVIVSLDIKELLNKKFKVLTKAIPLSILQAVLNGIIFVLLGISAKHFDGFSASVGARLFVVPTFLLISLTQSKPQNKITKSSWKLLFFIAFIDVIAFILYNLSVQVYQVSFAAIMQGTIPVVTAIISFLFFKERLTTAQKAGIVITVIGAISLGI